MTSFANESPPREYRALLLARLTRERERALKLPPASVARAKCHELANYYLAEIRRLDQYSLTLSLITLPAVSKATCRFNPYPPHAYDKHTLSDAELADLETRLPPSPK